MMKSVSRFCFLVLTLTTLSRGDDVTSPAPPKDKGEPTTLLTTSDDSTREAYRTTASSPFHQTSTPGNETDPSLDEADRESISDVFGANNNNTLNSTRDGHSTEDSQTTVPLRTTKDHNNIHPELITTRKPGVTPGKQKTSSPWAYVILFLILLVIIILCVILYLLRRVSRSYSFDLQRPVPTNRHNEPAGTFGQVYLDDLDLSEPKDQVISDDLSSAPVVNGTTLQLEEKISNGETAPEEKPGENGIETLPTSNTSRPLGDDQADTRSNNSTNLFFDAIGEEQQNENNNNNPSVCSTDPFVEINLEGPALCDQLLTLPESSSSPLSFSPFSFSSSSS